MSAANSSRADAGERVSNAGDAEARLSSRERVTRAREEMLTAFVEELDSCAVEYCLLSGFEGYPAVVQSDVDFMVRPRDARRIAPLLQKVAKRCDALLVQGIRHETGAWYFVLAKLVGGEVAYLHPDCTTDYRRDGRLWLRANEVLRGRLRYRTFFVPSMADEFLYYLIKKVLKQRIAVEQLRRIRALYVSHPEECSERMARFWSRATANCVNLALAAQELGWMRHYLPALLAELLGSAAVEGWWKRALQQVREWKRRAERVVNPTGLAIAVCGGSAEQRAELAVALEKNLRPAFRRTRIVEESAAMGLRSAVSQWLAKVRSTLVIRTSAAVRSRGADLSFVLTNAIVAVEGASNRNVHLDGRVGFRRNAEYAMRIVLEWMAERLRRRMKLGERTSAAQLALLAMKGMR